MQLFFFHSYKPTSRQERILATNKKDLKLTFICTTLSREYMKSSIILYRIKNKLFSPFPQPQYVLRMFLIFGHFSASCSYEKGSYKVEESVIKKRVSWEGTHCFLSKISLHELPIKVAQISLQSAINCYLTNFSKMCWA